MELPTVKPLPDAIESITSPQGGRLRDPYAVTFASAEDVGVVPPIKEMFRRHAHFPRHISDRGPLSHISFVENESHQRSGVMARGGARVAVGMQAEQLLSRRKGRNGG